MLVQQIQPNEESAKLYTFNTPFGQYMFKRLPFDFSSSQDIFQRVMSEMFEDIEGVEVVVDDIIVHGENKQQHDASVRKSLLLKFEAEYVRQSVNERLQPDPKKV